jgi:hypothetical protein
LKINHLAPDLWENLPEVVMQAIVTKTLRYAPPRCEYDYYSAAAGILSGSELTDDGAGDFLIPGEEFTL